MATPTNSVKLGSHDRLDCISEQQNLLKQTEGYKTSDLSERAKAMLPPPECDAQKNQMPEKQATFYVSREDGKRDRRYNLSTMRDLLSDLIYHPPRIVVRIVVIFLMMQLLLLIFLCLHLLLQEDNSHVEKEIEKTVPRPIERRVKEDGFATSTPQSLPTTNSTLARSNTDDGGHSFSTLIYETTDKGRKKYSTFAQSTHPSTTLPLRSSIEMSSGNNDGTISPIETESAATSYETNGSAVTHSRTNYDSLSPTHSTINTEETSFRNKDETATPVDTERVTTSFGTKASATTYPEKINYDSVSPTISIVNTEETLSGSSDGTVNPVDAERVTTSFGTREPVTSHPKQIDYSTVSLKNSTTRTLFFGSNDGTTTPTEIKRATTPYETSESVTTHPEQTRYGTLSPKTTTISSLEEKETLLPTQSSDSHKTTTSLSIGASDATTSSPFNTTFSDAIRSFTDDVSTSNLAQSHSIPTTSPSIIVTTLPNTTPTDTDYISTAAVTTTKNDYISTNAFTSFPAQDSADITTTLLTTGSSNDVEITKARNGITTQRIVETTSTYDETTSDFKSTIAEKYAVFFVDGPFTFKEANEACRRLHAVSALKEDLIKAWEAGFNRCDLGWLKDMHVAAVKQSTSQDCKEKEIGVLYKSTREPLEIYEGVYCVRNGANDHTEVDLLEIGSNPNKSINWWVTMDPKNAYELRNALMTVETSDSEGKKSYPLLRKLHALYTCCNAFSISNTLDDTPLTYINERHSTEYFKEVLKIYRRELKPIKIFTHVQAKYDPMMIHGAATTNRTAIIKQLVKLAKRVGLDGLIVNYEPNKDYTREHAEAYRVFLDEFYDAANENGLSLGTVISSWGILKYYDIFAISKVDFFGSMGSTYYGRNLDRNKANVDAMLKEIDNSRLEIGLGLMIQKNVEVKLRRNYRWNEENLRIFLSWLGTRDITRFHIYPGAWNAFPESEEFFIKALAEI